MSRKVLVVEDDPSFAEFLEVTVRATGHQVRVATDGVTAMEAFQEFQPDLVFLDLLVPRKDGHALCEEIRADPRGHDIPIVVVTGIYKKKEYREAVRSRFDVADYLVKPVQVLDVWGLLDRHLGPQSVRPEASDTMREVDATGGGADSFAGTPVSRRPLAAVLRELKDQKKTGLLFLKDRHEAVILYVDRGRVVFARSNDPDRRLGAVLEREGRLSPDERAEAEALVRGAEGVRMGEVLIGMGLLRQADMEAHVRRQIEEMVAHAFRCQGWRAQFVEGDLPDEEPIRLELDTPNLILRGVRGIEDIEVVRAGLPGPDSVLAPTGRGLEIAAGLDLTPYEREMLALCDGVRNLRKVLGIARLAPVCIEKLLYAWFHGGVLEVAGGPGSTAEEPRRSEPAAAPAAQAGCVETGDLKTDPFPALLARFHRENRSGILELERGTDRGWLYLDAGRLVFAGSNDRGSRIGEVLVESRLVSAEARAEMAEQGEEDSRGLRLGQRFVERGDITLEELSWAVTLQMQKRLHSLFRWREGTWIFRPGPFPTDETITMSLETPDVIMEGIRRMEPDLARSLLPDPAATLALPRERPPESPPRLTPEEKELLQRIETGCTVGDLLGADAERGRRLYGMLLFGLAEAREPREETDDLLEEADRAMEVLTSGHRPAPRPRKEDMVPRFLLEQSLERQEEMRRELFGLYRESEDLRRTLSRVRDELQTLRTSPILRGVSVELRDALGTILEEHILHLDTGSAPPSSTPPA